MAPWLAAALARLLVRNVQPALATAEEEYSAYEDPEKPVIFLVLSDPANVLQEFRNEFGLSEREVGAVLAAPGAENAAFSETFAKSQVIAESRIQPWQARVRL